VTVSLKRIAATLIAAVVVSSCASSRLHREGLAEIQQGRYEEGLSKLEEASRREPGSFEYRLELKARHDDAVVKLLGQADRARGAGSFDAAELSYRRVLAIEPGNERAVRGLDVLGQDLRHRAMAAKAAADLQRGDVERAETAVRAILAEDPGFAAATTLQGTIDMARGPVSVVPRLKTRENRPVTLQFRDANTKMVFEVLSRQTGVNFIFDKDVKSDGKTTIFVQQVPVDQAIDLVIQQNQLGRQVLSDNMVLIYPNTAAKQKEYQDEIVKTFYLTNTEPKKAQELLKTVLNAKTMYVDDKANVLVMRDTPEAVRMAEKLVASLDVAESEVMLEVEVLEITRSNLQQVGIEYPTSATLSTPSKLNLANVTQLGKADIGLSSFTVTADLLKQVGRANTLASPRVRARNHEKAKILIGSRVPVITNSVTPTSSGSAVVTGSVQYLDVGLTLDVEPTVHLDNEVSIKLNLEVSSITKQVTTASGTVAYEIGTRNAQTLLTLKDGETQILAGLIQNSDTRNSSHIPGLGDIPILGKLFGSDRIDKEKSEIVLSITPRVIRSPMRPNSDTTEFWYGTESNLRSAPLGTQSASAAAATSPSGAGMAPAAGTAVVPAAAVQPADVPTMSAPAGAPMMGAAPSALSAVPPATPAALPTSPPVVIPVAADPPEPPRARAQSETNPDGPNLSWSGSTETKVGQGFDVAVNLSTPQPLGRISSQLHFDGGVLQLDGVEAGDLIPADIQSTATPKINQRAGVVQYVLAATKDSKIQGDGGFMVLHFKALAPATSTPITLQFVGTGVDGRNIRAGVPAPLTVAVAP
jgi:general secretion pathway protein D